MALVPAGGGDGGAREALARACHFCGEPSAGPCAVCRLPICGEPACSTVHREADLRPVVLCPDCARARPLSASRPWIPAALGLAGAAALVAAAGLSPQSLAALLGLGGALLLLAALATLWSRLAWRRRLDRARGAPR